MLRAPRWDVRRFSTLASTNDWLLGEARRGAPEGLVALARHQSAGRGRLGRRWDAPPGSALLVSVLLRPMAPPGSLFAATAAVAIAAADACLQVAGVEASIKWPNDLVVPTAAGTAKVAGILAESDAGAAGGDPGSVAVVVGLGLNVAWAPEGATSVQAQMATPGAGRLPARRPGTRKPDAQEEEATPPLADRLLEAFLAALGPRAAALGSPEGRAGVLDELRERCVTIGREVRVELGGGASLSGTAVGVDPAGRLVVSAAGGEGDGAPRQTAVAAGDVVHLRPLASRPR